MATAASSVEQHDAPNQKHEVMPLELFFDLVFVFAVSQLSHHLLEHLSWRGTLETLVLLVAVFTVWFTTSWAATIIPVAQSRTRWMVLAVMLLGLFRWCAYPVHSLTLTLYTVKILLHSSQHAVCCVERPRRSTRKEYGNANSSIKRGVAPADAWGLWGCICCTRPNKWANAVGANASTFRCSSG